MQGTRLNSETHLYFDESIDGYSNTAAGLIMRAAGYGLKIAYVDSFGKASKFLNFLENLSIDYQFVKNFSRLHIETFTFRNKEKIQKSIIPLVEFYNIEHEMMWKSLFNFDLVVFDNVDFDNISKFKLINILENKPSHTEIVITTKNKEVYDLLKDYASLVSYYEMKSKKNLSTGKLTVLTGDGKGKSTYGFGFIIREFINKNQIKLIYFDKGGDFYGERIFFKAIKDFSKKNPIYSGFDYAVTGKQRFDGRTFRFENNFDDIAEAREGLILLKTASKKNISIVADELNTTVKTKLLELESIIGVLKEANSSILMTGRYCPKEIQDMSSKVINLLEIKHYAKNGKGVRQGIDF